MKPVVLAALSALLAGCISINVTKTNHAMRSAPAPEPVAVEKQVSAIERAQGVEGMLSSTLPAGALAGPTSASGR